MRIRTSPEPAGGERSAVRRQDFAFSRRARPLEH